MSKVRIYDLAKDLKPEIKKNLEVARRMGVLDMAQAITEARRAHARWHAAGAAEEAGVVEAGEGVEADTEVKRVEEAEAATTSEVVEETAVGAEDDKEDDNEAVEEKAESAETGDNEKDATAEEP
jgi:hypothetical protein